MAEQEHEVEITFKAVTRLPDGSFSDEENMRTEIGGSFYPISTPLSTIQGDLEGIARENGMVFHQVFHLYRGPGFPTFAITRTGRQTVSYLVEKLEAVMPQTEEIKKMDLLFVKREGSSSSDIPALPAAAPLLQLTDGHQDKRKDRGAGDGVEPPAKRAAAEAAGAGPPRAGPEPRAGNAGRGGPSSSGTAAAAAAHEAAASDAAKQLDAALRKGKGVVLTTPSGGAAAGNVISFAQKERQREQPSHASAAAKQAKHGGAAAAGPSAAAGRGAGGSNAAATKGRRVASGNGASGSQAQAPAAAAAAGGSAAAGGGGTRTSARRAASAQTTAAAAAGATAAAGAAAAAAGTGPGVATLTVVDAPIEMTVWERQESAMGVPLDGVYVLARTGKVYETWANLKPDAAEGDEILLRGAYIRDNVVLSCETITIRSEDTDNPTALLSANPRKPALTVAKNVGGCAVVSVGIGAPAFDADTGCINYGLHLANGAELHLANCCIEGKGEAAKEVDGMFRGTVGIQMDPQSRLTFDGLAVRSVSGNGIVATAGCRLTGTDLIIRHIGLSGLWLRWSLSATVRRAEVTHCGDTGIYADCAASEWTDITTSHCKCDGMTVDFPASAIAGAAKDLREALLKSLKEKPHIIQNLISTNNGWSGLDCMGGACVDVEGAELSQNGINAIEITERHERLQGATARNRLRGITAKKNGVAAEGNDELQRRGSVAIWAGRVAEVKEDPQNLFDAETALDSAPVRVSEKKNGKLESSKLLELWRM